MAEQNDVLEDKHTSHVNRLMNLRFEIEEQVISVLFISELERWRSEKERKKERPNGFRNISMMKFVRPLFTFSENVFLFSIRVSF